MTRARPGEPQTLFAAAMTLAAELRPKSVETVGSRAAAEAAWSGLPDGARAALRSRGAAHGLDGTDTLRLVDEAYWSRPELLLEKFRRSELSHIVSRANEPGLASEPTNIVLEPAASHANQARGAADMSHAELEDVVSAGDRLDATLLGTDLSSVEMGRVYVDFGTTLKSVGLFGYFLPRAVYVDLIHVGRSLFGEARRARSSAERDAVRRRVIKEARRFLRQHGSAIAAAFLLTLVAVHVPLVTSMIAAAGLGSLTAVLLSVIEPWIARLTRMPYLAPLRRSLEAVGRTVAIVRSALRAFVEAMLKARDMLVEAVRRGVDLVCVALGRGVELLLEALNASRVTA